MSRHGLSDECDDNWAAICSAGAFKQAVYGKRGQAFLRELAAALDAMPRKELIEAALIENGECCGLGAVALARGTDVSGVCPEDYEAIARLLGISVTLTRNIEYANDESDWDYRQTERQNKERRWQTVRDWAQAHIEPVAGGGNG